MTYPQAAYHAAMTTRCFLLASALALPLLTALANDEPKTIRLAFIGVGGRGGANLSELTKDPGVKVTVLCDVNAKNLAAAAAKHPDAMQYKDFRQVYAEAANLFDAVVVSTTEHTHAFATLPALKLKKPVYCEKPLTHNVKEAGIIQSAAQAAGVPTQMGTQIHGLPNYRRVVEQIQSGSIGPVREVHVCVERAWGLQSAEDAVKNKDIVSVTERPKSEETPPESLDWDLWIGPAPYRPYHSVYFPGPKWYRWWDFGNGTMSDLGSHWNDLPWWALKLDAPLSIEPVGSEKAHPEIAPATMHVVYEYGPRADMPAVKLHWHQGATKPDIWKNTPAISAFRSGVLFIGDKGMLISDYSKFKLLPEAKFPTLPEPTMKLENSPGQHQEWLNAIRHGTPTGSPFATYAGPLTIANHLGNVAFRVGKKIYWDAEKLECKDCPEAAPFLGREPRAGWSLK
jgi:predicted dehydrogenase